MGNVVMKDTQELSPRSLLDRLLLIGLWLAPLIGLLPLILFLIYRFSGMLLYRLWTILDYVNAPWIPLLLGLLLALTCGLFLRQRRSRQPERRLGLLITAWTSLVVFLLALPMLGFLFLLESDFATPKQTAFLDGHTYYVSIENKADGFRVLLHKCDSPGLFCRQVYRGDVDYSVGANSPITARVDPSARTVTIFLGEKLFYVYTSTS